MASETDTVNNKILVSNLDDKSSSSKVPSKEPTLKLNMEEFREMKRLETAGDVVGVEDLKKKVRQRMELELASDPTKTVTTSIDSKKTSTSKQVRSTTAASTSNSVGNLSVKNDKNTSVNHKRTEITSKNGNMVSNEDRKIAVKKVKAITTSSSKSTSEILIINNEKHKEKSKFSASASKIDHTFNKGKAATIRQKNSTSTSKGTNGTLPNNKGRQTAVNRVKTGNKVSSSTSGLVANKSVLKLEKYVERWKLRREKGEKYKPLEIFIPPEILNNKNMVATVQSIAKEFELERLRRLLEQDKEKPNGDKRLAQKRIEHLNNFGKNYTRLEIAAARNDEGPKKDPQIRAHITFLNEKNIIKHKITSLDVIEDPSYLRKGLDQKFSQRREVEKQKDLERKRKLEGTWEFKRQEKLEEERKHKRQQKLELERRSEKLEGKFAEQRRHIAETKRRQEIEKERARKAEVHHRNNRIEDFRNPPKIMTNRSEALKSTSLKKRTFDERSGVSPSSRAPKRRNFGVGELDICGLDEATVNQNMSSIIHSIIRPGRRPMYGIVDDNDDDDVMEVSGYEVFREEARSSRLARKEDEDEERAEQRRRIKKLNRKKAQGDAGI